MSQQAQWENTDSAVELHVLDLLTSIVRETSEIRIKLHHTGGFDWNTITLNVIHLKF